MTATQNLRVPSQPLLSDPIGGSTRALPRPEVIKSTGCPLVHIACVYMYARGGFNSAAGLTTSQVVPVALFSSRAMPSLDIVVIRTADSAVALLSQPMQALAYTGTNRTPMSSAAGRSQKTLQYIQYCDAVGATDWKEEVYADVVGRYNSSR
jgi:hypothetical protein